VPRTQVAIVGAGPAGLLLSHLLHQVGVRSVVLESRSRAYVEQRVRAGVLEDGTRQILLRAGLGERMERQGLVHEGVNFAFEGSLLHFDFPALTGGHTIIVYGQQEVVKDLIRARSEADGEVWFEAEAVRIEDVESRPRVVYRTPDGSEDVLEADFVAGCDGSHGISRAALPDSLRRVHQRAYPFAWLGILAEAPPASHELIYVNHPRGFALFSMRSPRLSRNYIQVRADEPPEEWSDDRIWEELQRRVEGAARLTPGPVLEKSLAPLRSLVVEPMQHGRLFLAGDAAHVVPPTGAKGLNLAVCDVVMLSRALADYYRKGEEAGLRAYTERCLEHVWQAEHFSWWMTQLLHRLDDPFEEGMQRAQLRALRRSEAARRYLAENYTGVHTSLRYVEWVPLA
jgi:p-hydroxybenzoate 3-monooxygenase